MVGLNDINTGQVVFDGRSFFDLDFKGKKEIRKEIGINSGIGAMGPYAHANVAIGRAYSLLSQNGQGGSVPGETYMGTLGNPLAYSLCFGENEERSPWGPLHVDKGFKPTDSTVSVFVGNRYIHEGFGPRDTWQEKFRRSLQATAYLPPVLVMLPPAVIVVPTVRALVMLPVAPDRMPVAVTLAAEVMLPLALM